MKEKKKCPNCNTPIEEGITSMYDEEQDAEICLICKNKL